jgi:hypothetical protein
LGIVGNVTGRLAGKRALIDGAGGVSLRCRAGFAGDGLEVEF